MKWENRAKHFENLMDRLSVHQYKKDYKIDFEQKSIGLEMVQGLDAFIQQFKKVLLTTKTPKTYYGLADLLPNSLNQEKFNEQSEKLAYEILNHQFSDSTSFDPHGLGHTVTKVYSIEFNEDNQTYTFVLGAEGEFECPKITFQAPTVVSK
ncbi:hypothetical protein [Lysinibacillus sp. NPDC096212]|uniref:hypothetical protein n=1 Tax=Lysinibacillus sp. NPDC096212 TaxID=3364135 RepID=UPI003805BCBC